MKVIFEHEKRERCVFHFNKASNTDDSIPMWTVKHKGKTYYVNHLDSEVGFSQRMWSTYYTS